MINDTFSIGKLFEQVQDMPSFRIRDRDPLIHDASAAVTCHRQIGYKKLGFKPTNPADLFGQVKMFIGSAIESSLNYKFFSRASLFGLHDCGGQGSAGEHGTFYGTSWHGFRDRDIFVKTDNKFVVVELKTKLGGGAAFTLKETPWGNKFVIPQPDTKWGQAQQISLYLRDTYLKTKDNPRFKQPIVDGILLLMLFQDEYKNKIAGFVEYFCEYDPKTDSVHFYRAVCHQYPQCNGKIDVTIKLKDIADRFKHQDSFISKGELPPPEFERKYAMDDPKIAEASKTQLTAASKNQALLGDMFCKYCSFRDKCAKDLEIDLDYTPAEVATIKKILKTR